MAGVNPYIEKAASPKATRRFKITFVVEETGENKVVDVDPATYPFGDVGQEGSILSIAEGTGDVEINHSCGGVCACSTCHVYVEQGLASCSRATDDEEDMIDEAPGLTTESRLACQCVPNGTVDLVVRIPGWNRNLVKEGH